MDELRAKIYVKCAVFFVSGRLFQMKEFNIILKREQIRWSWSSLVNSSMCGNTIGAMVAQAHKWGEDSKMQYLFQVWMKFVIAFQVSLLFLEKNKK